MSMSHHISHICSTVTFYLRNIARIRRFIDQSACHNAVRSLVLSGIDYCNGLLSSIPATQLDRVQRLQKLYMPMALYSIPCMRTMLVTRPDRQQHDVGYICTYLIYTNGLKLLYHSTCHRNIYSL